MKRLVIIRGGVAMALMFGILVVVASSAEASPSGQLGVYVREGLSLKRAQVALATQSQVEVAGLPVRLEKALGASFAGMWFEPSRGKFCIGVVSGASRRAAEQVVAQTGLAGVVRYVSVRSTWTELSSAQGEWAAKLEHLGGQQSSTGLSASQNAVSVTLSSSVPEHERALLEREAAGSDVNVSITVVPPEALVFDARKSQCEVVPRGNYAFCSKPIAAGVLITPNERREGYCTAGPLAILFHPATLAAELETLLITAGHCLERAAKWFTATHPGNVLSEIGPRVQFVNGLPGDYGDIEVGPNWLEVGLIPTFAQITYYQDNGLREARNVIGEEASVERASFCKQGATSAEQCGTITALKQLGIFSGVHVEGLVKTNACGEGGDSGGPYHTETTGNAVRILGTEVGGPRETCSGLFCKTTCESYYEPIRTSLAGLGLTLLTVFNQLRHTSPPWFLTESGAALLFTADNIGKPTLRGKRAGVEGTITCEKATGDGFVLDKSPLAREVNIEFSGKCEQEVTGSKGTCTEPIKPVKSYGELGLLNGHVVLLVAPESGEEFTEVRCTNGNTKVLGAVIGEFPLNGRGGSSQYGVNLKEFLLEFAATGVKQNIETINLLGVEMKGVSLKVEGFLGEGASEEATALLLLDGGGTIDP